MKHEERKTLLIAALVGIAQEWDPDELAEILGDNLEESDRARELADSLYVVADEMDENDESDEDSDEESEPEEE